METIYEIQRIKQVIKEETVEKNIVRTPEDGAKIARKFIADDDREIFFVMCLNTKNKVVAVHRAHVGSLNASIVRPADVFKAAILNNSASIVVCHQHPSNNCLSTVCFFTVFNVFYDNKNGSVLSLWKHYIQ